MLKDTTTRPTLDELKQLIRQKTVKRLAGDSAKSEHETFAEHTRTCGGCVACWNTEIAEAEMWERGI